MLIELHSGLPWQREKDKHRLEVKKLNLADNVLLIKFPGKFFSAGSFINSMSSFSEECHPILPHLRKLNCYNRPNYSMIHECFLKLIKRIKVSWTAPYDWEDLKTVEKIVGFLELLLACIAFLTLRPDFILTKMRLISYSFCTQDHTSP